MSVFVCGSLHLDIMVTAPHLPRVDETVTGQAVSYAFGGKGGNQAVAAARMGAQVAMAGRVGSDRFGDSLLKGLAEAGVDATQVLRDEGASGMSVAIVQPDGDYGAVIVSAANLATDPDRVSLPADARVLLLQNEVPGAVNLSLAAKARARGCLVLLNAAPARPMAAALLAVVDLLVVNRVEAEDLLSAPMDPLKAVASLSRLGPRLVCLTLGADGLVLWDGVATKLSADPVTAISSHGAGDAFIGALAARLDAGDKLPDAVSFAQAAAALHVSTPVPDRALITQTAVRALQNRQRPGVTPR